MKNRSEQLQSIRPSVKTDTTKSTDLETFQSESLRPILKFQNELILSLVNNYLSENKIVVKNLTDAKKAERINHTIKNNLQLKQLLLGCTIAYFTEEELAFYYHDKKEITKRIITMMIERVCSQLDTLQF